MGGSGNPKTGGNGPKRNAVQLEMTPARKEAFLAALRESGGVMATACRVASPHSPRVDQSGTPSCWSSFQNLIARDPVFAAAVEEVREQCRGDIEAEIFRRGQQGWDEPVFQKGERVRDHDGQPATIRKFSDALLLRRAAALMPQKYSEKRSLEVSGHVTHGTAGMLTIASADLISLDANQRTALTGILKTIQSTRKGEHAAIENQPVEVMDVEFEEVADNEDAIPY